MHCSVAQCLEVVGEWWSMLILRDVFLGVTRFDDFQQRLGISRNILNQRLNHLVETDVLEKVRYSDHPLTFFSRPEPRKTRVWEVRRRRYGSLPPAAVDGLGGVAADAVG